MVCALLLAPALASAKVRNIPGESFLNSGCCFVHSPTLSSEDIYVQDVYVYTGKSKTHLETVVSLLRASEMTEADNEALTQINGQDTPEQPAKTAPDTKPCKFCAEEIKAAAAICRFCNREQDVSKQSAAPIPTGNQGRQRALYIVVPILVLGVCAFFLALGLMIHLSFGQPQMDSGDGAQYVQSSGVHDFTDQSDQLPMAPQPEAERITVIPLNIAVPHRLSPYDDNDLSYSYDRIVLTRKIGSRQAPPESFYAVLFFTVRNEHQNTGSFDVSTYLWLEAKDKTKFMADSTGTGALHGYEAEALRGDSEIETWKTQLQPGIPKRIATVFLVPAAKMKGLTLNILDDSQHGKLRPIPLVFPDQQPADWHVGNSDYGYSFQLPEEMFTRFKCSEKEKYLLLHAEDGGLLRAWSGASGESKPEAAMEATLAQNPTWTVTDKQIGDDWFAISGSSGDRCFHQKSVLKLDDMTSVLIEYNKDQQKKYERCVPEVMLTFKLI